MQHLARAAALPGTEAGAGAFDWQKLWRFIKIIVIIGIIIGVVQALIPQSRVEIGPANFIVEVADTPEARTKGLGGRSSLPADHGMLFVFETSGRWPVWMQDMQVPIDVVWIDQEYKVVDIKTDIAPSTFPQSFQPQAAARYLLEVPAGSVNHYGIRPGDFATFYYFRT